MSSPSSGKAPRTPAGACRVQDLLATAQNKDESLAVLDRLATERLITKSDHDAEVAHEALIRQWPELRGGSTRIASLFAWSDALMEDAREWQRLNSQGGALLAGARLVEAEAWLTSAQRVVAPFVREFIEASVAQKQRELEEREAQRQAQLDAAESKAVAERSPPKKQAFGLAKPRRGQLPSGRSRDISRPSSLWLSWLRCCLRTFLPFEC